MHCINKRFYDDRCMKNRHTFFKNVLLLKTAYDIVSLDNTDKHSQTTVYKIEPKHNYTRISHISDDQI